MIIDTNNEERGMKYTLLLDAVQAVNEFMAYYKKHVDCCWAPFVDWLPC